MIYLTGYKGNLGKFIYKSADQKLNRINYNKVIGNSIYIGLENLNNEDCIIHAGATLKENIEEEIFVMNNYTSLLSIVNSCKNKGARLIFISANSIGKNEFVANPENLRDKYTLLKYKCEQYIQNNLPKNQYFIIRLPGLYIKGKKSTAFLDKVFYSECIKFKINSFNKFNNLCLYSDAADFIYKLALMKKFEGFIGSIASTKPIYLKEIIKYMIGIKPSLSNLIDFSNGLGNDDSVYDFSRAISLGYNPKPTEALINYLYGINTQTKLS